MNRLSLQDRARILGLLVEGNSLRSITRLTGNSINTVTKLLVDVGYAASIYQHEVMRDLPCKNLQLDEIWSFCNAKERNVSPDGKELGQGDVWTWTELCADTKLIPTFFVGRRTAEDAHLIVRDLAARLKHRVQITTDGLHAYLSAVSWAFADKVDYATLQKVYGRAEGERRYSPPVCTGAYRVKELGQPDMDKVSTSHIDERQNLKAATPITASAGFSFLSSGFE